MILWRLNHGGLFCSLHSSHTGIFWYRKEYFILFQHTTVDHKVIGGTLTDRPTNQLSKQLIVIQLVKKFPTYWESLDVHYCVHKSQMNLVHISDPTSLRPSHPHWFDHHNNIWWSVQVTELLTVQSSTASCHFLPHRSKYSPQHPVLRNPWCMFFP
jgi:hypothetical protein